jgi:hypothetical protein
MNPQSIFDSIQLLIRDKNLIATAEYFKIPPVGLDHQPVLKKYDLRDKFSSENDELPVTSSGVLFTLREPEPSGKNPTLYISIISNENNALLFIKESTDNNSGFGVDFDPNRVCDLNCLDLVIESFYIEHVYQAAITDWLNDHGIQHLASHHCNNSAIKLTGSKPRLFPSPYIEVMGNVDDCEISFLKNDGASEESIVDSPPLKTRAEIWDWLDQYI